ncbi:unnamed protein product [Moneuplotes crassus]|uniref:Protein kinase domain-containing protein n=1 Tax=Euplotes crassus TaxID=5936 RepID=A0AAD1XCD0_EUPCR|nr:unnamed protein product [Moneuplotes crassus]
MSQLCKRLKKIFKDTSYREEQSDLEMGSYRDSRSSKDIHLSLPSQKEMVTKERGSGISYCQIDQEEEIDDGYYTPEEMKENQILYKDKTETLSEKNEIQNFQIGDLVGKGTYAQVFQGFDLDTGKIIAIKQVPILKFADKDQVDIRLAALKKEIKLLRSFDHPNIVKYLGNQNDGKVLNIFLEYVSSGSISSMLNQYKSFDENLTKIYIKNILKGLDYLHAHNVIHGDIKGSNVLVDDNGICKLADFGGSNRIIKHSKQRQRMVGTAQWMAPEVIRESKYDRFSDIWSVGCVVIEMLQGSPPWSECDNIYAALFKIAKTRQPPQFPPNITYEATDFLQRCLNVDSKRRPNVRTLLNHPFITNDKMQNSVPKDFYGVEMISSNFKNFYEKFTFDNNIEEEDSKIKNNFENSKEEDSKRIQMSDCDASVQSHEPNKTLLRYHTKKSMLLPCNEGLGLAGHFDFDESDDHNPFANASNSESMNKESSHVKVFKGGRIRGQQNERFTMMKDKSQLQNENDRLVLKFPKKIVLDDESLIRCRTQNNISKFTIM